MRSVGGLTGREDNMVRWRRDHIRGQETKIDILEVEDTHRRCQPKQVLSCLFNFVSTVSQMSSGGESVMLVPLCVYLSCATANSVLPQS